MDREEIKKLLNEMLKIRDKRGLTSYVNGKNNIEIKNYILKETDYLPKNSQLAERIYHILNDIYERPICKYCENYLIYIDGRYKTYCSNKCKMLCPINKKKTEQTNHKRYNCKNPNQNKEIQRRAIKTKREKFKLNIKKFLKPIDLKLIDVYTNNTDRLIFKCLKCGKNFEAGWINIQQGKKCPYCSTEYHQSKHENEINNYLKSIIPNTEIVQNERQIIKNPNTKNSLELDFYIPEKKIAIEFNGLYWHSDKKINKNYHLMKTNLCKEKGIRLIHIFEDEWIHENEEIKLKLKNILLGKEVINLKEEYIQIDLRWEDGLNYEKSGYGKIRQTKPKYWYANLKLKNRSEDKISDYKIYDCGSSIYKKR